MPVANPRLPEQIGPYRIVARVGAGGMGEVFKAWDPRLERDVAVKLLHPEMAADPDRQKRLIAEGRAASALNHPNIVRVYDADVDGSSYYLVSEWLEGKSLRDELRRGPMSLKRLLDLAVQIADGLAAAHGAGIVHRDIKPENIMLARDGTARIVDFGLAKSDPNAPAMAAAAQQAATVTASLEGGLSGTPAYMSPEQARGTAGDFRTDQFSFGVLLYEMATGTYAFRRDTVADTLSAVLHDEPKPIGDLNARVPAVCQWIIEQCLAKDAADRYSATDDLAKELRRVRDRLREASAGLLPVAHRSRRSALVVTAIATAVVVAAAMLAVPGDTAPLRFLPVASAAEYEGAPAWSPDGQSLAYVGDVDGVLQVFVKRAEDAISQQVTRTRFDAERPFWAPNGERLYFISLAGDREGLWSVGVAGGAPTLVFENVSHAAIDPKGSRLALIVNNPDDPSQNGLWWSTPPGAPPVAEPDRPADTVATQAAQLAFAPDGRLLVWTSGAAGIEPTDGVSIERFYLYDAMGGRSPRRIFPNLTRTTNLPSFTWLADSRHIAMALRDERLGNRHLWIADTESDSIRQLTTTHTNETTPAASWSNGRLAYATDEVDFDLVLISPDGRTRQTPLKTARNEFAPTWSRAGDQFAFATDRSGALEIWTRSRDGQWQRPIVTADDFGSAVTESLGSLAFSPDGRTLAYQRSSGGAFEVWLSPVTGGKPVPLVERRTNAARYQDSPAWSPDGDWVAYTEWVATNLEASAASFTSVLRKARVGTGESLDLATGLFGYTPARWSEDGQWILFQIPQGLARIRSDGGTPQLLTSDTYIDFVWAPDSRRVYALAESDDVAGHFALVEIDADTGAVTIVNPDLGAIPVAYQPIRGFSFLPGHGFLTSLASARSDIWLLEGVRPPAGWLARTMSRIR